MRVLDLFSCVGCHAIGMHRAGFQTVQFVEWNAARRRVLAKQFPETPIHDDVRTFHGASTSADIVIGGPPCQRTSKAAAIHGRRDGVSLWPEMRRVVGEGSFPWVVVEQPPGDAQWEANCARDLIGLGYHVARFEFEARDVGAPYERRRVFILACTSVPRLEVAWRSVPSEIESVARAADARGAWNPDQLAALRVDARSAGEMDRGRSRGRVERIEALGDSNPPEMAEVIGRSIMAAMEPAREAVALDENKVTAAMIDAAFKVCPLAAASELGTGAMQRIIAAALSASPAPAAGGLEAVLSAYEAETRALPLGAASREKGDSAYNWRMSVVKDLRELAARLASPAATLVSHEAAIGETQAALCSTDGTQAPAATSAETQGGDGVQNLIDKAEKLIEAADDMSWSYNSSSADQAIREAKDAVRAALAPSTSAATRGEPVAWSPMSTAPKGYPTEDAGCRGTSEWFFGRVAKEFRKHGAAPFVPRYFDGWRPLNEPAPAVESAQVKEGLIARARHAARVERTLTGNRAGELYDALADALDECDPAGRIRASLATDAEG